MNDYSRIPNELKSLKQWVCSWDGSKVPMQASKKAGASSTSPATWSSFEQAVSAVHNHLYDHIGFVFTEENGLVGIDIDAGFEDGLLTPMCVDIIKHCQSYTEKSKSGRGVHIFLRGSIPFSGKNNSEQHIEIYKTSRYFITTGKVVIYDEIIDNQEAIDYVVGKYFRDCLNTVQDAKSKRKGVMGKNYTPEWQKPKNGGIPLKPEYPEIQKGGRHTSLVSLAGQMWSIGYEPAEIYKELLKVNQTVCKPPLTNGEVERIVKSIQKYKR